jgi:hypothetical protein
MKVQEGDILQKGLHFYRIYSVGKDVAMNRILYNPKTERLQIYHGYDFASWNEIGTLYYILEAESVDTKAKLELVKRKYKLQYLNKLSEE